MKPKWLLIGGIGVLALMGGTLAYQAMKAGDELTMAIRGFIHSVSINGLALGADLRIQNPTSGKLKMRHPFIKVSLDGSVFATSRLSDQQYEIKPYQEILVKLLIDVPFQNLIVLTPVITKLLTNQIQEIPVEYAILTRVSAPGVPPFDLKKTEVIKLTKPQLNGTQQ